MPELKCVFRFDVFPNHEKIFDKKSESKFSELCAKQPPVTAVAVSRVEKKREERERKERETNERKDRDKSFLTLHLFPPLSSFLAGHWHFSSITHWQLGEYLPTRPASLFAWLCKKKYWKHDGDSKRNISLIVSINTFIVHCSIFHLMQIHL